MFIFYRTAYISRRIQKKSYPYRQLPIAQFHYDVNIITHLPCIVNKKLLIFLNFF